MFLQNIRNQWSNIAVSYRRRRPESSDGSVIKSGKNLKTGGKRQLCDYLNLDQGSFICLCLTFHVWILHFCYVWWKKFVNISSVRFAFFVPLKCFETEMTKLIAVHILYKYSSEVCSNFQLFISIIKLFYISVPILINLISKC